MPYIESSKNMQLKFSKICDISILQYFHISEFRDLARSGPVFYPPYILLQVGNQPTNCELLPLVLFILNKCISFLNVLKI